MTVPIQRFSRMTPVLRALTAVILFSCGGETSAQTTRPAEPATATRPAGAETTAGGATTDGTALVADVQGQVNYSLLQPDGTYGAKQPVKKGDRLPAGAKIQTRYRSFVVLAFGGDTVVKIDPLTEASVDQFVRTGETKNVVLGLGHGMVRAGSVAPTLRSEMSIVTPTATLTKRGTFECGLRYEAGTGRYMAYLTQEGLVEVLNNRTGLTRTLEPNQQVTQAMTRWIETAVFNRWVPVQDVFGLTPGEVAFNSQLNTGPGVASPGGGSLANMQFGRGKTPATGGAGSEAVVPPTVIPQQQQAQNVIGRAEGNFGARR